MANISIIGAGFSGLSAASYLAKGGHEVTVYEKNASPGGRARQFTTEYGYTFDMGPSWYWMPDIFEQYFNALGYNTSDFYELQLLDPAVEMVFEDREVSIPSNFESLCDLFESIEAGSADMLHKFMHESKYKYEKGMKEFAHMPGLSFTEFMDPAL